MHRFFAIGSLSHPTLSEDDLHHARRVLRFAIGEQFECVVHGHVHHATVTSLEPFLFTLGTMLVDNRELPFHLTLLYGVPKGDKWTWVMQKAVELGVHELIGFHSQYSVVHWTNDDVLRKQARYEAIIKEATMQSKRTMFMQATRYLAFKDVLALPFDYCYIASEHDRDVQTIIKSFPKASRVAVLVGSEGGFSIEEVALAKQKGWQPLGLGPRILRTETAAIVAIARLTLGVPL
jgi:16S rRNA (uracil1498-N3)-methyltransferase